MVAIEAAGAAKAKLEWAQEDLRSAVGYAQREYGQGAVTAELTDAVVCVDRALNAICHAREAVHANAGAKEPTITRTWLETRFRDFIDDLFPK